MRVVQLRAQHPLRQAVAATVTLALAARAAVPVPPLRDLLLACDLAQELCVPHPTAAVEAPGRT